MENKVLKVFTAFSGYDSQCLALNRLAEKNPNFKYELVGWSEIDEYAIKAHNALFPQYSDRNQGDISKVDWKKVPDFDLLTYSSPCFVAGTEVLTNLGSCVIENVTTDHYVITHTASYKRVLEVKSRMYSGDLYKLRVNGQTIICTPNHPFYVSTYENRDKFTWVEAQDLKKDEHLCCYVDGFNNDGCTPIMKVCMIGDISLDYTEGCLVYNLEVEDDESYTANLVVVHNCTDFSLAGKQAGGEEGSGTRSSLLWECRRCIEEKRPKYLILENVTALVSAKFYPLFMKWVETVESYGYENFWSTMNAKDYGIPQNRDRVFLISIRRDSPDEVINFSFPAKQERTCKIEDILEDKVDEKYFINQQKVDEWVVNNEHRIAEYIAERNGIKVENLEIDKQKSENSVQLTTTDDKDDVSNNSSVENIDVNNVVEQEITEDCMKTNDESQEVKIECNALFDDEPVVKKDSKSKKKKKDEPKTTKKGHLVKQIPTPTCTGNVAPTLMATGYATADYKNFYSVGHFPKLGILEVWKEDNKSN